jgi:lipoate-protein ligase A
LLRSPAEGYIKARGVESVRSAIRNVGVGGEEFADAVVEEFRVMYGGEGVEEVVVGEEEALEKEEVVKGLRELTSPEWIFGQTPQFTFSTHPTEEDPRERPVGVNSSPHSVSTSPPHPTDWAN